MNLTNIKLVTIIANKNLKKTLIKFFKEAGVSGYTYYEAYGKGSHQLEDETSQEIEQIQFKVLATDFISVSLMKAISEGLFSKEKIIVFQQDAHVIRGEKFEKAVYGL
jgi:nitrogen regulatory protein PII